jgi:gas vesicle protein
MKNSSKILIGLGAGLVVGGILGVLLAPDKGSATRHRIAEAPKKLANRIKDKMKMGREKLNEETEVVNEYI